MGKIQGEGTADVFVKLEYMNPSGSLKDRIILQMIRDSRDRYLTEKKYTT